MEWKDYEEKFITANKAKHLFNEKELEKKLQYAYKLHQNDVPIIYDVKHLSLLTQVHKKEIYKITNSNSSNFYTEFFIPKKSGGEREIRAPLPNLKLIQNWILVEILSKIKPSEFCKSYQKGYSLRDNAKFHRKQKVLVKLDIYKFFDNIKHQQVYDIFKEVGYNKQVAMVLTKLCVLNEGTLKSVPQGAPSSPMISNLVLKNFDDQISNYCLQHNIRYTRYADDLTFSGNFKPHTLIKKVESLLYKEGFLLNKGKRRIIRQNRRQIVTGIVVNEKFQASRDYRRKIRLEVYYLTKDKDRHFETINIKAVEEQKRYIQSLLGRINYVLLINKNNEEFKEYKRKTHILLKRYNNTSGE